MSTPAQVVPLHPNSDKERVDRSIVARWGGHEVLNSNGWVPVERTFLEFACQMRPFCLNPTETLFVIQLMFHKWDGNAPYPSYRTLARRMGVSETYARKLARQLEAKGFLRRVVREGTTNRFDLGPLFEKLAACVEQERMKRAG